MKDDTEVVRLLIEGGAPLDDQDEEGFTPLHRAVLNGRTNVVQLLITSQASLDLIDNNSQTPTELAKGPASKSPSAPPPQRALSTGD